MVVCAALKWRLRFGAQRATYVGVTSNATPGGNHNGRNEKISDQQQLFEEDHQEVKLESNRRDVRRQARHRDDDHGNITIRETRESHLIKWPGLDMVSSPGRQRR